MRNTLINLILLINLIVLNFPANALAKESYWPVQSVDTMKFSRDLAREKENDLSFEQEIATQIEKIRDVGATHVAIATPYDDEFIPFLTKWVRVARENDLNVWFRGNFSGWEGWFDYEKISRAQHLEKTARFIRQNPQIFEDGDIFTTCTECENGGSGDPRDTGDVNGYREFLVESYGVAKEAFREIGKNVSSNYFSMNGDVAYLIMDKKTTEKLDGIVVIDHYVKDPMKLSEDIAEIARRSGGLVVLGEFGAPIPDINGTMTEYQQALWIDSSLAELSNTKGLVGINYWTGFGGTTNIWNSDGGKRSAVDVLSGYYHPTTLKGRVINELGRPVKNAVVAANLKITDTDKNGYFSILILPSTETVKISAAGYEEEIFKAKGSQESLVLSKSSENVFYRLAKIIYNFFRWRV